MENRKIISFEKDVLRHIRVDINDALRSVCEKYGMSISIGNIKFTQKSFHAKMSCVIINSENGLTVNPDKVVFEQYCRRYTLKPTDFGATFKFGNDFYEICGIKQSSHKYPILARRADGKEFRFAASVIKNALVCII